MSGVAPALVVSTLGVMVAHLSLSLPVFPWRVDLLNRAHFRKGWSMVRVGVPYIMATAVNMSVAMGISLFITNWGSLSDVACTVWGIPGDYLRRGGIHGGRCRLFSALVVCECRCGADEPDHQPPDKSLRVAHCRLFWCCS